jgi:hypothetical protein
MDRAFIRFVFVLASNASYCRPASWYWGISPRHGDNTRFCHAENPKKPRMSGSRASGGSLVRSGCLTSDIFIELYH